MQTRVAVVQHSPVYLDRAATLARAVELVKEAAAEGAQVVVLPEAFVPGYPTWGWRLRPGNDMGLCKEIHARLLANSVDLETDDAQPLFDVAKETGVVIVCGINEREGKFGRATLFNTVITIGPDGALLNRHRKLMPTNHERTIWGQGDASGLRVVDTPFGRIGALPCWESLMPLARMALYAEGVEIFIAPTWDCGDGWLASMRHIAREGGCWVIGSAAAVQGRDLPKDLPGREQLFPDDDEWLCNGDSVVMAPFSGPVAGPLHKERGIVYADCDLTKVTNARRSFDVAGHYNRPDVFQFQVNRKPARPADFID
jgi:nitrilase